MDFTVTSKRALNEFGVRLGHALTGGEVIQLRGDVGAGKTTLTKAIAKGMGVTDTVSSPSYALSQRYDTPSDLSLVHYDFYRLDEPGVMADELSETVSDSSSVIIVEWGDIVSGVLPDDHIEIAISPLGDTTRRLVVSAGGESSQRVVGLLR